MTPARSLRSAALSRLSHESAATPTSVSGTPRTTASPFSKQHPGLLKCLTFYRTQSGLLRGAGTLNLCFFFYKQKDDSCRSTGTVTFVTHLQTGKSTTPPSTLCLLVTWGNANSRSRKVQKTNQAAKRAKCIWPPAPLLFFPPSGH